VSVILAYLKSYAHMGIAHIGCVHGCSCTGHDLDANQTARESTTHLHRIVTTQHEECTIAVIVTRRTNSLPPEHKFKISGVMMSDETTGFVINDGAWSAAEHHDATRNLLTPRSPAADAGAGAGAGAGKGGAAAAASSMAAQAAAAARDAAGGLALEEPAVREVNGVQVISRQEAEAAARLGRNWQRMAASKRGSRVAGRGAGQAQRQAGAQGAAPE
jgi:hypothetical protein